MLPRAITDTVVAYLILGTTIILMQVNNPTTRSATSVIADMHDDLS